MREKLAELCHEQRSNWMKYLFSKCHLEYGQFDIDTGALIIPQLVVDRWNKQMKTPYNKLSEKEKESDRKEADKFLALLTKKESNHIENDINRELRIIFNAMVDELLGKGYYNWVNTITESDRICCKDIIRVAKKSWLERLLNQWGFLTKNKGV